MKITRTTHITAPPGDAVHAYGQSYTAPSGRGMIESVVHHAFNGEYYYTRRLYRRVSNDNGRTWTTTGPVFEAHPSQDRSRERIASRHFLDPHTGLLLAFHSEWLIKSDEPQFSSHTTSASYRIYYEVSRDRGLTWEPKRQLIHRGSEFNPTHWMPGITYGRNGGYVESCVPVALDDGTIVVGMTTEPLDEEGKLYRPLNAYYWFNTGFLRSRWNADRTALDWEVGDYIKISTETSASGVCEPDVVCLGGTRLFATLRCQGDQARNIWSSRQGVVSHDGGLTWSPPTALSYDDGSPVFVPAAYSSFLRSPRTGKVYWFCNILDHAVSAQYPRCPLSMAEFDPVRLCLVKSSVRVIQDLPPGAPRCASDNPTKDEEFGRQYTNFGAYVDRETGEMVLVMPEMPKTSWREFTSDCIRIQIRD